MKIKSFILIVFCFFPSVYSCFAKNTDIVSDIAGKEKHKTKSGSTKSKNKKRDDSKEKYKSISGNTQYRFKIKGDYKEIYESISGNTKYKYKYKDRSNRKYHVDMEVNLGVFLFPIDDWQYSSSYKLDNKEIPNQSKTDLQYYCAVSGQKIWAEYTKDPTDQANFYYFTFTPFRDSTSVRHPGFNKRKQLKVIIGLTHDKATTPGKDTPFYYFNNGGGELTLKVSCGWNIARNIKNYLKDYKNHLIIDLNVQAGGFISMNEDSAVIKYNGLLILNQHNTDRNIMDRTYEGGGMIANLNGMFGYSRRTWNIAIGYNIGAEYQHNVVMVKEGASENHHLSINTCAVFLSPIINFGFKHEFWAPRVKCSEVTKNL